MSLPSITPQPRFRKVRDYGASTLFATPPSTCTPLASPETPLTFHPWPRLPEELKLAILTHVLIYTRAIPAYRRKTTHPHFHHQRVYLLPLLETKNYNLAKLAGEVYYKQNVFVIDLARDRGYICPWPSVSCCASWLMRKVDVSAGIEVRYTIEELLDEENEKRWLFRRRDTSRREEEGEAVVAGTAGGEVAYATSEPGFEALDVLTVRIELYDEGEVDYLPPVPSEDILRALKEMMGKVELVLRAKEVIVNVGMYCMGGYRSFDEICRDLGERATKRL